MLSLAPIFPNRSKKYAGWRRWDHQVVGWINDRLLPIPVNIDTVNGLFDETIKTEPEMDKWLKKVQVPCTGECKNFHGCPVSLANGTVPGGAARCRRS